MTQLPPRLKESTTTLKCKRGPDTTDAPDIMADTCEGDLSPGHEMERDDTTEEDENDSSQKLQKNDRPLYVVVCVV